MNLPMSDLQTLPASVISQCTLGCPPLPTSPESIMSTNSAFSSEFSIFFNSLRSTPVALSILISRLVFLSFERILERYSRILYNVTGKSLCLLIGFNLTNRGWIKKSPVGRYLTAYIVTYLVATERADRAMITTKMAEPIRAPAKGGDVLTSIRQKPVIPHE